MPDEHNHNQDHRGHGQTHDDPFHVHPTGELDTADFDPASRSLAEALRISFGILKAVVIVLLIVFVGVGGYRKVEEGQVGVRVRLGAVQGERTQTGFIVDLLEPGPHFALPEPIDRIILVPTKQQLTVIQPVGREQTDPETGEVVEMIDTGFWFEQSPEQAVLPLDEKRVPTGGLKPGRDGSLITADQNIVHGKWTVNYSIPEKGAAAFAMNVGAADVTESLRRAEMLVRQVTQRAIVHVVAQTSVDDFTLGRVDRAAIRLLANDTLERMDAGVRVDDVLLDAYTPPLNTRAAFNAVTSALSERDAARTAAEKEREQILAEAAGAGWRALLAAIDDYEQAREHHPIDSPQVQAAAEVLDRMLADPVALADYGISGAVAELIQAAQSQRTNFKTLVEAEANTFQSQYRKYTDAQGNIDQRLRRIMIQRLWQDTVEQVFAAAEEVFWLPRGTDELYIEFGPNPAVRRAAETDARRRAMREQ